MDIASTAVFRFLVALGIVGVILVAAGAISAARVGSLLHIVWSRGRVVVVVVGEEAHSDSSIN